jgi:hypothetical protein
MANFVRDEVNRRTGWFRPFCLSVLVLILLIMCAFAGILFALRQNNSLNGLISALTGGPAPITIQATTVLERIQALSEILTTSYNYSSLVNSQRDMPGLLSGLYGDKLLMVAVGQINAGIDAKKITVDEKTLTITLPSPELFSCFLDEKSSYVVSRDTGIFARPAPNLDQEARRFAVAQFRDMALKDDIYGKAQTQAKTIITEFVESLNIPNDRTPTVITLPPDPNAPMPDSCR